MAKEIVDIAIVAANYNNGEFLVDFIESIQGSSKLPAQLIIADDGSTDNSHNILKKYENLNFSDFIYFEKNKGFAHALNAGVQKAATKYIMRADPDDILYPEKIAKQFEFLEKHSEYAGVGCNVIYFHSGTKKNIFTSNFPINSKDIKKTYLSGDHGLQHPTVLVRTEAFKKYQYKQETVPAEDYDIFARMISDGYKFSNLPDALYNMRVHTRSSSSNLTTNTTRKTLELRKEIFGINYSKFKLYSYYYHTLFYRRFLLSSSFAIKYMNLVISVIFNPKKLFKRL